MALAYPPITQLTAASNRLEDRARFPTRPLALEMTSGGTRMEAGYAWIVCAWIALHLTALAAAYGTRIAAGSRLENVAQFVCLAAMLLVGVAIWISQQAQAGSWGLSAVTLMAMVLTAVVDFRKLHDAPHSASEHT
jgi:hypothetical protein